MAMMIIVSQFHIGCRNTDQALLYRKRFQASSTYTPGSQGAPAGNGCEWRKRTVCVPPTWEGFSNEESLVAARLYPDRSAVMGRLAIHKPESREVLPRWKTDQACWEYALLFTKAARRCGWKMVADRFWVAPERHDVPVMAFAPQPAEAQRGRRTRPGIASHYRPHGP